jgi:TonB-dependent starch-binding outer membrane protein SusC
MKKKGCVVSRNTTHNIIKYLLMTKLAILLIFAISAQSFAHGFGQGISLKLERVQLKKVFKVIEEQGIFRFVYNDEILPRDKRISIEVHNASLDEVLEKVLLATSLTYRKLSDNLVVITSSQGSNDEAAVAIAIGGKVTNEKAEPLAGVSILEKGTNNGVRTKEDGSFSLDVTNKNAVLVFSFVGYKSQEISISNKSSLDVILQTESSQLNDVVVIGYGTRQRKDLTSAVATISSKDIEKSTALSPELAMQGQMPGVSVTSGGGDPTARPTIRIRGVGTFNSSDPLYVIDGIPLAEGGAGATVDKVNDPTRRGPVNLYTIVNPNDIESISVLKDASAAAVYGVRAANGVILITTKSGKKGRIRIDVDANYGTQQVPKTYQVLDTKQFTQFYTTAYNAYPQLNGTTPVPIGQATYFGPVYDPANPQYLGNSATYNWQDVIINHSAKVQNYNVRASGATDNVNYNFSAGYANNDGPFKGVNTERYSLASNVATKIGKYIETGINLRLVQENINNTNFGDNDLGSSRAAPWQPIYDANGPLGYAPLWKLNQPLTPATFDVSPLWGPQFTAYGNYLGNLATGYSRDGHQTIIGSGYFQVQPIPGLKIKGSFSGQQLTIATNSWIGFDRWWFGETPANPYSGVKNPVAGTRPGNLNVGSSKTSNTIKGVNIDYAHSFGKHNIDITLDGSQQEYTWTASGVNAFVTSEDPTLRYINPTGNEQGYYNLLARYVLIGYLGRVSYNYENKYYADVVVRRDGSSRFAPGHQWGTFPSGSVAWRISQENFMKNISFLSDLKLRASYGLLGNEQTTGGWEYLSVGNVPAPSYSTGNPNVAQLGIAYTTFPNSALTWEKLRSTSIGFDALLFQNSLSLTVDYYHKITKGIIQSVSLNPSTGIEQPADLNIADVLNQGFEFQAGYNRNFGPVGFTVSANLTTVHNEVLLLANHTALRTPGYSPSNLEEGLPIGFIYGYKVGGIFQSQDQIDKWNIGNHDAISKEQKPGDMYFQNLYGKPAAGSNAHNPVKDTVVDANDQTYLGKTIPGYFYGFSVSLNFKGFDVSAFFQGVGDVQRYNSARASGENLGGYGRNLWSTVLGAWTDQNHSTSMPRAVYQDPNANSRVSSRFVENASYLRLQNLQLGYTFPKKLIEPTKAFQSLRIYVTGINLFTITKYTGLDPENDYYPSTRQYLVGLRASF